MRCDGNVARLLSGKAFTKEQPTDDLRAGQQTPRETRETLIKAIYGPTNRTTNVPEAVAFVFYVHSTFLHQSGACNDRSLHVVTTPQLVHSSQTRWFLDSSSGELSRRIKNVGSINQDTTLNAQLSIDVFSSTSFWNPAFGRESSGSRTSLSAEPNDGDQ